MFDVEYVLLTAPTLAELKARGQRAIAETRNLVEEMGHLAAGVRRDAEALHRSTTGSKFRL